MFDLADGGARRQAPTARALWPRPAPPRMVGAHGAWPKPCAPRTPWLGSRAGAPDITPVPRTRRGRRSAAPGHRAQRSGANGPALRNAALCEMGRSPISPGAVVPLRGRFPTTGSARRQARNERAWSTRLDSQRGRWCPRRGWRYRAATYIVCGMVRASILFSVKKPSPIHCCSRGFQVGLIFSS
jgi:hypothetical protein